MTRGTLFYYESPSKVWASTEFNGDMYHGTPEEPQGNGDKVIKLMSNLNSIDDFKAVLKEINKEYGYNEGNNYWSVNKDAIEQDIKATIDWIETERKDLKGTESDPRQWKKKPSFKDVTTWQFWGVPNLSDYSYIYNGSKKVLTMKTKDGKMDIPAGALGVLNYGSNDCICKDGKIIDGMGHYKQSPELKSMNKDEFYEYITTNFTLDGTSKRIISNLLDYVENSSLDDDSKYEILRETLDAIGMTEEEIRCADF